MKKNKWKKETNNAEEILSYMKNKEAASLLYASGFSSSNGLAKYNVPSFLMREGSNGIVFDDEYKQSICFPSPSALACTFDDELAKSYGEALAKEAIHYDTDVVLAPSLGIKRNPLCGFSYDLFSEDPLLTGRMGASLVLGLQSKGVGACLKDFVCQNQATSYAHMDAQVDLRALNEIYLKPYSLAINLSDPWMVMTSYSKLNGLSCSDSPSLLNDVLKGTLKFRGVVASAPSSSVSPILSHEAGIDLEIPAFASYKKETLKALNKGNISKERFNDSAKRVLALALKTKNKDKSAIYNEDEQYALAERIAEESIVLAKNDDSILPLSSYKNVCLIGALAENFQIKGNKEKDVHPKFMDSLYREMLKYSKERGEELPYAPGYSLKESVSQSEAERLIIDAEELASKCEKVIFVVGNLPNDASYSYDRRNMRLSSSQISAFKHVYEHNKNIILVVVSGSPLELPMKEESEAVVISYFGGEMSAKALHRVLIGQVNPSGRLAETWPVSYSSVPSSCFYPICKVSSPYKESIYVGYRYYLTAGIETLFAFGSGLSYSKTVIKNAKLDKDELNEGDKLEVSLSVHNLSRRATKETVQLYVGKKDSHIFRPALELKDYAKVSLLEGETKSVKFILSGKDFSYFDIDSSKWQTEDGTYEIYVGKSSDNLKNIGTVEIHTGFKKALRRSYLPSYKYFTNKSLFVPSDHEFEELLGHRIKNKSLSPGERYSFESTIKSLTEKDIGRKIVNELEEMIDPSLNDWQKKALKANQLEMPLRLLINFGAKENKLMAYLDIANGNLIAALFHMMKGKRK